MSEETKPSTADQVGQFAALQFLPEQIEIILELAPGEIASTADYSRAYTAGALRGEADVRAGIRRMAMQGSAPAQKAFIELIQARRRDETIAAQEAAAAARPKRRRSRR